MARGQLWYDKRAQMRVKSTVIPILTASKRPLPSEPRRFWIVRGKSTSRFAFTMSPPLILNLLPEFVYAIQRHRIRPRTAIVYQRILGFNHRKQRQGNAVPEAWPQAQTYTHSSRSLAGEGSLGGGRETGRGRQAPFSFMAYRRQIRSCPNF